MSGECRLIADCVYLPATSSVCFSDYSNFLYEEELFCALLRGLHVSYIYIYNINAVSAQNNTEELRAERLRRATEKLRSPVVFNKDSAVRKTQLKSFSQYVDSKPGGEPQFDSLDIIIIQLRNCSFKSARS